MSNNEFIGMAISDMVEYGVNIKFNKRTYNTLNSSPYFTDIPKPELVINYFDYTCLNWFPDFIHEYSHFLQYKNESKKWKPYNIDVIKLFGYLSGNSSRIPNDKVVQRVQELELDADKKAIRMMKKYKLNVDVDLYTKLENLYVFCYPLFVKYRIFFAPCDNDEMLDLIENKHFSKKHIYNRDLIKNKKELEDCYEQLYKKTILHE